MKITRIELHLIRVPFDMGAPFNSAQQPRSRSAVTTDSFSDRLARCCTAAPSSLKPGGGGFSALRPQAAGSTVTTRTRTNGAMPARVVMSLVATATVVKLVAGRHGVNPAGAAGPLASASP